MRALLLTSLLICPWLSACRSSSPLAPVTVDGKTQFFIPEIKAVPMRALPGKMEFPKVSRTECIQIAQKYLNHLWVPTARNRFHGTDPDGIVVNTPDIDYRAPGSLPGWWVADLVNRGMPYQWGGFSSPDEFNLGISQGKYAGDVYTKEKRARLDDAVSKHAVGIDCSGFISRCWKLPRSFSTRELPLLCDQLPSYEDLQPGDILNTHNGHVLLFEQWIDPEHTAFITYETGSPPTWKVLRHGLRRSQVTELGYLPYRYRNMRS